MRDYRDLKVYHKAHAIAVAIHTLARRLRKQRYAALAVQLENSSQSVPANIAEGTGHSSRYEFARFLQVALASNVEVDQHLRFAYDAKLLGEQTHRDLASANLEVRLMAASLLRVVRDELSEEEERREKEREGLANRQKYMPKQRATKRVTKRAQDTPLKSRRHHRPEHE